MQGIANAVHAAWMRVIIASEAETSRKALGGGRRADQTAFVANRLMEGFWKEASISGAG